MKLNALLAATTSAEVTGDAAVEIAGIAYDSRQVKPGWLFVAVPGTQADGADYIPDAISNGAAAVVSEARVSLGAGITHVHVPAARRALAEMADVFHGSPSRAMKVVGVTGTNGKTTTTYMIRNLLRDGGLVPGLLGTVAYEVGERSIPAARTTPEAPEIHAMFRQMVDQGCAAAVMEISSHAIALQRVHGIDFDIAVFTNLTRDHLDFHHDMESYFEAKAGFMESMDGGEGRAAVINIDDPWGRRLVTERRIGAELVTYGFGNDAQVRAGDVKLHARGTSFRIATPWGGGKVRLNLLGRFNVHNALAAVAAGGLCGLEYGRMIHTLEHLEPIPGRLELIRNRRGRKIFVDYAHTDDALENVLRTLREICRRRLIVVFGCGGDRDHGKRSKMGRIATRLADYAIVTTDNPRKEDPAAIIADITTGCDDAAHYEVVLDRRSAIERGIAMMRRRDMLLVAGKGHETYQELNGTIIPFDDREIVKEIAG